MNIFLLIFAAIVLIAGARWLLLRAPKNGPAFLLRIGFAIVLLVIIGLAVTGRLHWLAGLIAGLLPFMRRLGPLLLPLLRLLPFLQQQRRSRRSRSRSQGQTSEITTASLHMTLDHDSGVMDGSIIRGPYAGQKLSGLSLSQLRQYYDYCQQQDTEAVRLLDAFAQRHFQEDWQRAGQAGAEQEQDAQPPPGGSSAMSREEALDILGLAEGASREEIIKAHKRMMLRVHPDRGGSHYLAIKINQAKEVLIGRHSS